MTLSDCQGCRSLGRCQEGQRRFLICAYGGLQEPLPRGLKM